MSGSSLLRRRPVICYVTDRRQLASSAPEQRRLLMQVVGAAARAGVDLIQVRERDLGARALQALVEECLEAVRGTSTEILVNDRVDVAMAAEAAGAHLRGDSIAPVRARALVGPHRLLGRSVHTVDEAREVAETGGADYLLFGSVFPSASKPTGHPAAGVEGLAAVARAVALPVLGIGGINVDTLAELFAAGAAGVAGIGFFQACPAVELAGRISAVRQTFDTMQPPSLT